jgi:hypothetical protein
MLNMFNFDISSTARKLTLEIRHLMSCFVNPYEAEVTILSHFTVLDSIDMEWGITSSFELRRIRVIYSQADCFAAEPVAYKLWYVRRECLKIMSLGSHPHLHNIRQLSLLDQEASPMLGKRTQ